MINHQFQAVKIHQIPRPHGDPETIKARSSIVSSIHKTLEFVHHYNIIKIYNQYMKLKSYKEYIVYIYIY